MTLDPAKGQPDSLQTTGVGFSPQNVGSTWPPATAFYMYTRGRAKTVHTHLVRMHCDVEHCQIEPGTLDLVVAPIKNARLETCHTQVIPEKDMISLKLLWLP